MFTIPKPPTETTAPTQTSSGAGMRWGLAVGALVFGWWLWGRK